jgi:diaminohydroxyphosphoribosylaminopyrimidine deaminase / 5-amino-6-(5-phosphoribosylamino)uracil reductase
MRWPQVRVASPAGTPTRPHEDLVRATGTTSDRAHLARAVAVAERARHVSSPNPPVGCVLVRDAEVVGEAATSAVGGPHAEVNALAKAGERARGATAYVTLEPCGHHGRTPPCASALRDAGVRRVVYGIDDPHLEAAGGARALRDAGVEVEGGVLGDWIACQLEGFLTAVTAGRPHMTLKLAHTVDGRLVAEDGQRSAGRGRPAWVTGEAARTAVHVWRAAVDAVLVGSGTVLADDPRLDVRHVPPRGAQPRAVVLDTRLRTPVSANIARPGTVVLTGPDPDPGRAAALRDAGVDVQRVGLGRDGRIDLGPALGRLVELGITSVLAEPGATLAAAFVGAGVVDRLVSHVALDRGGGGGGGGGGGA